MNPFVAVILICLNRVAPEACDETTAADVLSIGVESELACVMGWQDVVARSALAAEIGRTAYVKTLCRRAGTDPRKPGAPRYIRNRPGRPLFARVSPQNTFRRKRMIGRTLAVAVAVLLSTQVQAQTNQNGPGPAQGVVSGPAAGTPTSMRSPQAGPLETKHQRHAVRNQSQSVRNKTHQAADKSNGETGATGSSSPRYAPAPR
jgi:hypothetical protein